MDDARAATRRDAGPLLAGLLLGAVVLAALHLSRGDAYWNYSEGVYALTTRLWIHGGDLYGTLIGAQPPVLFAEGAVVLALHDALGWLRLVLGAGQLVAGGVAAAVVWRLSRHAVATALAPALVLLTPWAVHEHGSLTPEAAALPFLFGRRAALIVALSLAAFGTGVWRDVVVAQLHTGRQTIHGVGGYGAQGLWDLSWLLVPAGVALAGWRASPDRALLRVWTGLAVGTLLTTISIFKVGTALNILGPVEAVLAPLALVGVARVRGTARVACAACLVVLLAQAASLFASPEGRFPFDYPGSQSASGRTLSADRVGAAVRAARRCPDHVPYPGPPFIAFLAHRPMPGGQPDQFLPAHSSTLASTLAAMDADPARCPAKPPE